MPSSSSEDEDLAALASCVVDYQPHTNTITKGRVHILHNLCIYSLYIATMGHTSVTFQLLTRGTSPLPPAASLPTITTATHQHNQHYQATTTTNNNNNTPALRFGAGRTGLDGRLSSRRAIFGSLLPDDDLALDGSSGHLPEVVTTTTTTTPVSHLFGGEPLPPMLRDSLYKVPSP